MCASPLRRHVTAVDCVDLRLDHLQRLRELPRLTELDARWNHADLAERMLAAGDSRERRAHLLRDALPLRLRQLTWRLSEEHSTPSRQALLDVLPCLSQLSVLVLELSI